MGSRAVALEFCPEQPVVEQGHGPRPARGADVVDV